MRVTLEGEGAFGAPGMEPRWTGSAKDAVGTAYNTASRVWFTVSRGILNEIYSPTVDHPQVRDFQYLISDGKTFCHDEKRDLVSTVEPLDEHCLGYRIINEDPQRRYRLVHQVICDPYLPCVLVHTRLEGKEDALKDLRLYALLAPHLGMGGMGNSAFRVPVAGRTVLAAARDTHRLAMVASAPFLKTGCGYVGVSDGWTDVKKHLAMTWQYGHALNGNVALTAEIDLSRGREFTLAIAFGSRLHGAVTTAFDALATPFSDQRESFRRQWHGASADTLDLEEFAGDEGRLYRASRKLLIAHEDKTYPGAMIASLSIPWGQAHGDESGLGGYHLVWTRDLCQSAGAMIAGGSVETPRRTLLYLAASQLRDGGFYQNFWINGEPYWQGKQLDETAFPLILAWRLDAMGALKAFSPARALVESAAGWLMREGPSTQQERWEENSGYSPSTLAAVIAGLVCAADFIRRGGDESGATFIEEYADFLEAHVEDWTATSRGSLLPGVPRHYIRILPADPSNPCPDEDPDTAVVPLRNVPPGGPDHVPARDLVDAGFLELVRYGLRRPGDALIEDSLRVVDAVLKVETPFGPCWRRYNHDGYGQRPDGGPFLGWGKGRPWPILTGERGHYELSAGRDVTPYLRALEGFATSGGMLPEQIWDEQDRPELALHFGRPTGAAMPLLWAHAEYIKLLRSARDGAVFDRLEPVARRYLNGRGRRDLEIWKFKRRPGRIPAGRVLRVMVRAAFRLRWSADGWASSTDTNSRPTSFGVHYVDLPTSRESRAPLDFTFYWTEAGRWEGRDFRVALGAPKDAT